MDCNANYKEAGLRQVRNTDGQIVNNMKVIDKKKKDIFSLCFIRSPVKGVLFCLFGLILYITVNGYCHVRMVRSPNHMSWLSGFN